MTRVNDITEGNIVKALFRLALPIMGTSFVQMAYNMTDMFWVGRIGSRAVAAVGTAGFFTWLGAAFILISRIGAEVGVAQSVGKRDIAEAKVYIKHSIQLIVTLALIYASVLIIFRKPLIGFFNIGEPDIENNAITYLVIIHLEWCFILLTLSFLQFLMVMGKAGSRLL